MRQTGMVMQVAILVFGILCFPAWSAVCRVTGQPGNWQLEVNGEPFVLKGTGLADIRGREGADYFALAREMGANTLRTWGIDQGTGEYLDQASAYGLKVNAGLWLPHANWFDGKSVKKVFSYLDPEAEDLARVRQDILDYVKSFKEHPAIILWNVGNEVLHFTEEEEERVAFSRFLETLLQDIKTHDPNRPVLYTAASTKELPYLQKYVPSLDIIGMNTYGGVDYLLEGMRRHGLEKPLLITEFGPLLPMNRKNDAFGQPMDEADYEKAFHYKTLAEEIDHNRGDVLGGFVFLLGETTQVNLTWWNLTFGPFRRESFTVIQENYTGIPAVNTPPRLTALSLDQDRVAPGTIVTANMTAYDRENDELRFELRGGTVRPDILKHNVNEEFPLEILETGPVSRFRAPKEAGLYRLHAFVYDGQGNVGTQNLTFRVDGD